MKNEDPMNETEQATAGRMAMNEIEQAMARRKAMRARPPIMTMHRINITIPQELFERATCFGAENYIGSFSEVVRQALVRMMKKAATTPGAAETRADEVRS